MRSMWCWRNFVLTLVNLSPILRPEHISNSSTKTMPSHRSVCKLLIGFTLFWFNFTFTQRKYVRHSCMISFFIELLLVFNCDAILITNEDWKKNNNNNDKAKQNRNYCQTNTRARICFIGYFCWSFFCQIHSSVCVERIWFCACCISLISVSLLFFFGSLTLAANQSKCSSVNRMIEACSIFFFIRWNRTYALSAQRTNMPTDGIMCILINTFAPNRFHNKHKHKRLL